MERKKQRKTKQVNRALFTWTYKGFNQNLRKKRRQIHKAI
jgi:hypothetical protein